jgi:hypothetical protein
MEHRIICLLCGVKLSFFRLTSLLVRIFNAFGGTALQTGMSRVRFPMVSVDFFHWHNPVGRTMALGSTQLLTEMSTRNISWGVNAAGAHGWQPTTFMCRLSRNLGASTSWNPLGLSRPVMGLLYLYLSRRTMISHLSQKSISTSTLVDRQKLRIELKFHGVWNLSDSQFWMSDRPQWSANINVTCWQTKCP